MELIPDSIVKLTAVQLIRARPEMFIGKTTDVTTLSCMLEQCLCVALDQAIGGTCSRLDIAVDHDNRVVISDDGPGFPLQKDPETHERRFRLLTDLQSCRLVKADPGIAEHFCTAGIVVTVALSMDFSIETIVGAESIAQRFVAGEPNEGVVVAAAPVGARGTKITFRPDPSLFGAIAFDVRDLEERFDKVRALSIPNLALHVDLSAISETDFTQWAPRHVENADLGLRYDLGGAAPLQANGTVGEERFYFRARHDTWDFEVFDEDNTDPGKDGRRFSFQKRGQFVRAGWMKLDDAIRLIEASAREYLASVGSL